MDETYGIPYAPVFLRRPVSFMNFIDFAILCTYENMLQADNRGRAEHVWIHIAYNIFYKWYPTQGEKEMCDIYFQIKGKINVNSYLKNWYQGQFEPF